MYLNTCNTVINQPFVTVNMHLTKLHNIHTYTQHITWKPIQEKTTRCSSSRIGIRKQIHLFSMKKDADSIQYLIFYILQTFLPLMHSDLLSSFSTDFFSLSCSLFFSIFIALLYSYSVIRTHPALTRPSLYVCTLSCRSTTMIH